MITRRSSTRLAPGWFLGRCGSIAIHASSDNQNSDAMITSFAPAGGESENRANLNPLIGFGP